MGDAFQSNFNLQIKQDMTRDTLAMAANTAASISFQFRENKIKT